MEAYRYQQIAYLIVPVMLGMEFFFCAKAERRDKGESPLGSYLLDLFGFVFMALIPAVFIFTIWALESRSFQQQNIFLARLDRYIVLFFFFGAWWQIYMFGALRARRMQKTDSKKWYLSIPFLVLGLFISNLILWVSPWGLRWVSTVWFILLFGISNFFKAKVIERTMWILAGITFLVENILFIWFETIA